MKKLMLLLALGVMVCAFVGVQMLNAEQTTPSSQKSPAATSGQTGEQGATQSKEMKGGTSRSAAQGAEAMPVQASKLIGKSLMGANDEKVGKVEDLILDKSGRISYVIIGVGGLLGAGEKYTAVPWNVLAAKEGLHQDQRGDLRINLSKGDLQKAPTFEKSDLPKFAESDFRQKVDSHYSGSGIQKGHAETAPR